MDWTSMNKSIILKLTSVHENSIKKSFYNALYAI